MRAPVVRAPRSDNQDLCIPNPSQICSQVLDNHRQWNRIDAADWVRKLRQQSRQQVAVVASRYAEAYTSVPSIDPTKLWVIGGHQPELFHPGVWYKNFLIDRIRNDLESIEQPACGIHVIVDHDLPKSLSIKLPHRIEMESEDHVAMDTCPIPILRTGPIGQSMLPWHRYRIDQEQVEPFIKKIESDAQSLGLAQPMVRAFFDKLGKLDAYEDAAIAFSKARHLTELDHGLKNIDLPMSLICQTQAWFDFVQRCMEQAVSLAETYNNALDSYRAKEGITNPGQPVAHLTREGDWIELPFWLYRNSDSVRNRMWVRRIGQDCELASGTRPGQFVWTMIAQASVGGLQAAMDQRQDQGICLRPRALITTLYLRCFLADGFVHGIGGGLYDRLTDDIIRGFLKIEPPGYAIATATLHMPLPEALRQQVALSEKQCEELNLRSRRIRSAPESFLNPDSVQGRLLAQEHSGLIESMPARGHKKQWHLSMVDLKSRIRSQIDPMVQSHQQQLQITQRRAHGSELLNSREYSMVLFPESDCVGRLKSLASRVHA